MNNKSKIPKAKCSKENDTKQLSKWISEAVESGAAKPLTENDLALAFRQGLDRAKRRKIKALN